LPAEPTAFAFISLLRDDAEARGLAGLLEGLARAEAATSSVYLVPEVRGLDFFALPGRQAAVDRWWSENVPARAIPVYLLAHERGLSAWLGGLDGDFLVAADDRTGDLYSAWTVVPGDVQGAPLALAQAAVLRYGVGPTANGDATARRADVFDTRDARMIARIRGGAPAVAATPTNRSEVSPAGDAGPATTAPRPRRPVEPQALPPLLDVASGAAPPSADVVRATDTAPPVDDPDPLDLLAEDSARRERAQPAWTRDRTPAAANPDRVAPRPRRPRLPRVGATARDSRTGDAAMAALLLARSPTIVVVGSRKGGVGKTTHAAGMAITAGGVLDSVGHAAALVDANVANPDAWGQLDLPDHAATVRDVVNALAARADAPDPAHATTPALACYPERRDGAEYSRTDIRRLAAHLRARYALVVVDMSNRLPDPMSGPEATVAAFWLEEADALVLPTAMSRQDFNGVLDYLDVGGLPPTVVPCIASGSRRNRRHPMTRQYLDVIAARVDRVLEIPDEADRVRLAGMDGVPVADVSRRMRSAYRALTEAVIRLPRRVRV
jgi:hypothetical protein